MLSCFARTLTVGFFLRSGVQPWSPGVRSGLQQVSTSCLFTSVWVSVYAGMYTSYWFRWCASHLLCVRSTVPCSLGGVWSELQQVSSSSACSSFFVCLYVWLSVVVLRFRCCDVECFLDWRNKWSTASGIKIHPCCYFECAVLQTGCFACAIAFKLFWQLSWHVAASVDRVCSLDRPCFEVKCSR